MNNKMTIYVVRIFIYLTIFGLSGFAQINDVPRDKESINFLLTDFKNICEYCRKEFFEEIAKETLANELFNNSRSLEKSLTLLTVDDISYKGELYYSPNMSIQENLESDILQEKISDFDIDYIAYINYDYSEKGDYYFLSVKVVSTKEYIYLIDRPMSFHFKEFETAMKELSTSIIEQIFGSRIPTTLNIEVSYMCFSIDHELESLLQTFDYDIDDLKYGIPEEIFIRLQRISNSEYLVFSENESFRKFCPDEILETTIPEVLNADILITGRCWKEEEKIGCEIRLINSNNGEYESIFLGSFTDPYFIKEYSSSYEIVSEVENYLRNFSKNLRKGE